MANKNLQTVESKELVSISDINIRVNNDLDWYGDCQIDLDRIRELGVDMMIIPNLDEEGAISSDDELLAVFRLQEGIYAIGFSNIDGSSIVRVGSDDPEDVVFTFDKEYYTENVKSMLSGIEKL
jgi:fructose-1,6-bisphosphatase